MSWVGYFWGDRCGCISAQNWLPPGIYLGSGDSLMDKSPVVYSVRVLAGCPVAYRSRKEEAQKTTVQSGVIISQADQKLVTGSLNSTKVKMGTRDARLSWATAVLTLVGACATRLTYTRSGSFTGRGHQQEHRVLFRQLLEPFHCFSRKKVEKMKKEVVRKAMYQIQKFTCNYWAPMKGFYGQKLPYSILHHAQHNE